MARAAFGGYGKTELKMVPAAGAIHLPPVQPSDVATEAETREPNIPGKKKGRQCLYVARVRQNGENR